MERVWKYFSAVNIMFLPHRGAKSKTHHRTHMHSMRLQLLLKANYVIYAHHGIMAVVFRVKTCVNARAKDKNEERHNNDNKNGRMNKIAAAKRCRVAKCKTVQEKHRHQAGRATE